MNLNLINHEEDDSVNEILNGYDNLPEKVRELISGIVIDELNSMIGLAESCKSPIEQLLGLSLEKRLNYIMPLYGAEFGIIPQKAFDIDDKKYFVDFFINVRCDGKIAGFVVECDGHDFHEKTKEQAKSDKKRERDFLKLGHQVIRFTGSEIFANAFACAREVTDIIIKNLEK